MPDYDKRRPRLPRELGEAIDAQRGLVPFNTYVVDALTRVVRAGHVVKAGGTREKVTGPRVADSRQAKANVKPIERKP